MPKVQVRISVLKVQITMRFPCKLQIGFRINDSETLSDDIVQLNQSQAKFKGTMVKTFSFDQLNQFSINRGDLIKKESLSGQLVLYAVYAKRKIAIGFINLNLLDIAKNTNQTIKLIEKWERCPDKSALAELQILKLKKDHQQDVQTNTSYGYPNTYIDSNPSIIIKKSTSGHLNTSKTCDTKMLAETIGFDKIAKQKYLKVPVQNHPSNFNKMCQQYNKKNYMNYQRQIFFQPKPLEIETFNLQCPEVTSPISPSASSFLSPQDQIYVQSLKLQVFGDNSFEPVCLNRSLAIGEFQKQSTLVQTRFLQGLQSPRESSRGILNSSRGMTILQKKLTLTQQYYKKQLQNYSKKLLQVEQQRQSLSVQLSIKEDEIKWIYEGLQSQKQRFKFIDEGPKGQNQFQQKQEILFKLKQWVNGLQRNRKQLSQKIQILQQQLQKQKAQKIKYQESIETYYSITEDDKSTIVMLNQEIARLNRIIKQIPTNQKQERLQTKSKRILSFSHAINDTAPKNIDSETKLINLQKQLEEKEKQVIISNQKTKQLQEKIVELNQKIYRYSRKQKEMQKFVEERDKYLADIKFLAQKVSDLEKQKQEQTQVSMQIRNHNDLLKDKVQSYEKQVFQLKKQIQQKAKKCQQDQENIKEFEAQLTEKYKIIYSLETSLKDQKQRSRNLSRSIEGKSQMGKLFQFSFSQNCNHNFGPLCLKMKDIKNLVYRNKVQALKEMNVEERDSGQIGLIKQYVFLDEMLKRVINGLEENQEKVQVRSPKGKIQSSQSMKVVEENEH